LQRGIERDLLVEGNAQLLGLVVIKFRRKNREARGDRAIEQIWFGESETDVLLEAANLRGKRKRLA
jgi:hypothetical protein